MTGGWFISQYQDQDFESYDFTGSNRDGVTVEGRKLRIAYAYGGKGKKQSSLQVIRNYENAMKKIGGTVVYKKDDFITLKLVKGARETWAEIASEVDAGWGGYTLTIVEKGEMAQEVTADAAAMGADIKSSGHVAIYGINFDTGESDMKSDSEPALNEIAKLLKQDGNLKIFVVGHTDNVGSITANIKLSQSRAEAVRDTLVSKYGISANRLSTFGAGPHCPVTSNVTEEGRTKNRRVELVQQ